MPSPSSRKAYGAPCPRGRLQAGLLCVPDGPVVPGGLVDMSRGERRWLSEIPDGRLRRRTELVFCIMYTPLSKHICHGTHLDGVTNGSASTMGFEGGRLPNIT